MKLDAAMRAELKKRRTAGESWKALASEVGVPWQRLWVLMHDPNGETETMTPKKQDETPVAKMGAGGAGQALQTLAEAIEPYMGGRVDEKRVREITEEVVAARLPRPIEVNLGDGRKVKIEGRVHKAFDDLMQAVKEGHHNILLVGPAGSGKTTLAKNLAEALELPFGFISLSAGVTETHLLGRVLPKADGSWGHVMTRFIEIYVGGGVFLLDELDGADSNVLVAINAALANGVMCNPITGEVHVRHANCYVLGAGNTWGRGGDTQYVGRNQLDAATLDRFVLSTIAVEYDAALEADIVNAALSAEKAGALLQWVGNVRAAIRQNRLRRIASTRLVVNGAAAMSTGIKLEAVQARYFMDWTADERSKVEN